MHIIIVGSGRTGTYTKKNLPMHFPNRLKNKKSEYMPPILDQVKHLG